MGTTSAGLARRTTVAAAALGLATALAVPAWGASGPPVKEIVAGHGLTGGGGPTPPSGSVELAVDPAIVQSRVTGACPAGASIRSIGADGTVTCEADDDGAYSAGLGLALTGFVFSVDTSTIQARVAGSCGAGEAIRTIAADGTVACTSLAGGFVRNGTAPQDASFNVTGSGVIGAAVPPFDNKLRVKGGAWNPDDTDGDLLIGDSAYRFKVGVATGGGGAGDVRLRAMGGTNRMMIGGGLEDTLTITPDRVGIGTITPERQLDVTGDARIGAAAPPFSNKLWIKGGNWNPNDSDTDVLIGDAAYRLKVGVATGGGGAGDVRIRAQGGTDRIMIGGGSSDTLTVRESGVGIGTITPQDELDLRGDARISGTLLKSFAPGTYEQALPLAYGIVPSGGSAVLGTNNAAVDWNPTERRYEIAVAGVSFGPGSHTVVVTPRGLSPRVMTTFEDAGKLVVIGHALDGSRQPTTFSFVVYDN